MVGSAIENAAKLHLDHTNEQVKALVQDKPTCQPVNINFRELFLAQEEDDEENSSLAEALRALDVQWGDKQFKASEVSTLLNNQSEYVTDVQKERAAALHEFLYAEAPAKMMLTAKGIGKRLTKHQGEPVKVGEYTLCLKMGADLDTKVAFFYVQKSA